MLNPHAAGFSYPFRLLLSLLFHSKLDSVFSCLFFLNAKKSKRENGRGIGRVLIRNIDGHWTGNSQE